MDAQAGTAKFKRADELFNQGKFAEALGVLNELDTAFPNTRNILYAKAMCLQQLGHIDEAESVCDWLLQEFQDPRAQTLKEQIQAARATSAANPFAGLDMNALDGLLEPTTRRMPAQRPEPPSNMKRNLLIVAVVLIVGAAAAAGYVGMQKGWFFGPSETVEQVEAKLVEQWSKADSYSAVLDAEINVPGKMPGKIHASGSLDYAKKGDKTLMHLEGVGSMKGGPMPMDIPVIIVSDGNDVYIDVNVMGKSMVMKTKAQPSSQLSPDVTKVFQQMHEAFEIKLLPEEMLDGMKAYVFQLTPKPGATPGGAIPGMDQEMGVIKASFTKDTMAQVRFAVSDKAGAPLATFVLKDIKLNADLKDERFKYTPPAGAQVMDMMDAMKMIPKM